ncbi:MAG: hypothetical protein AAGI11_06225 [Pseudomonadota bacterium]
MSGGVESRGAILDIMLALWIPPTLRALGLAVLTVLVPAYPPVLAQALQPSASDTAGASDRKRFQRTAAALADADPDTRVTFAKIALITLSEAFLAEVELARSEIENSSRPAKLASWSGGVERYSENLLAMLDALDYGDLPEISVYPFGTVALGVQGERVLLNHPRSALQSAFEQQVLAEFCALQFCRDLTLGDAQTPIIDFEEEGLALAWSFSVDGPVCTRRALSLQFTPAMALPAARMLCEQLFSELGRLFTGMAREQRHGVMLDWEAVTIEALEGRSDHLITLNDRGDALLLPLPLLADNPAVVARCLPWGRYLLAGELQPLALTTDEFGWE